MYRQMVQLYQMVKIVHIMPDGSALSDGEDYTDTVVPDGSALSDGEDCTDSARWLNVSR